MPDIFARFEKKGHSRQTFTKITKMKFRGNRFSGRCIDTCGQKEIKTDGQIRGS